METKILNAGNRALEIEKRLYSTLRDAILDASGMISAASKGLAEIDLASALASLAVEENWCRPEVNESKDFHVEGGRHPVVEAALRQKGARHLLPMIAISRAGMRAVSGF